LLTHKELRLISRTRRFIQHSGQLLSESEKLMAEWQKLIDDQTARTFKRITVRLKRKRGNPILLLWLWQASLNCGIEILEPNRLLQVIKNTCLL